MKYVKEFTKEISFPLGGIGTGSIGLSGNGSLIDWEIFNRPSKGSTNRYTNFAVRAIKNDRIIPMIMRGDANKDFIGQFKCSTDYTGYGFGPDAESMCGFPHFENIEFDGEFPVANLTFKDDKFPGGIKMKAFNPFIPNDSENSSIPAAFFEIEVSNTTKEAYAYQIAFSVSNPYKVSCNESFSAQGFKGLMLLNKGAEKNEPGYGDLTIATDCKSSYVQAYWYRGGWFDAAETFWHEFSLNKTLTDRKYDDAGAYDTGTLIAEAEVQPGESKKIRFVLSWNVPNCYNYWSEYKDESGKDVQWKNYYATCFKDSRASAIYSLENWLSLQRRTETFKDALYGSTFPEEVKDAAFSNLSVLKSPTVLRLEDGSFYGWEGVTERAGSCEGTCQHVWNYAYALCFLFPDLERSIRNLEFKYSTDKNGRMGFRLMLPLGRRMTEHRACVDGQMGSVIKCYREWKISGDNMWLKDNWNNIKKILEYAWSDENYDRWDKDKDGVLEGRQHHTLDMELFGPSSWLEGMYLAALKAASEMADYLGDTQKSAEYGELFEKGYNWMKNNLFNGKYFIQKIDINDKNLVDKFDASQAYWNDEKGQITYQVAEGSIIDQMLAQWHADILGLGEIFDRAQVSEALSQMMKNNFKPRMRDFTNPWRIFSVNDEAGTVICDYPDEAEKPVIPIPYSGETMTGFEYSFAGLLISRGRLDDGLKVVKAVRNRFDGNKRNPWNEFECGSNYARSMASYALVPILSGFSFDMPNKYIGFNPYKTDNFKAIWSVDGAWGEFEITKGKAVLTIFEGELVLNSFGAAFCDSISSLSIDGKILDFNLKDGIIYFEETKICGKMEILI